MSGPQCSGGTYHFFVLWTMEQSLWKKFSFPDLFSNLLMSFPSYTVSFFPAFLPSLHDLFHFLSHIQHQCFLEVLTLLHCLVSMCLSADVTFQACLLLLFLCERILSSKQTCTKPYLSLLRPLMYIVFQNACTTMPRNCLSITFCCALQNQWEPSSFISNMLSMLHISEHGLLK